MCESNVHACVKPSCSARLVNSTMRQAGGSVWKVTPKSILLLFYSLFGAPTMPPALSARRKLAASRYPWGPSGQQVQQQVRYSRREEGEEETVGVKGGDKARVL